MPKAIQDFIVMVNSNTENISVAKMNSQKRWLESGQTPEFDECTVILKGILYVKTKNRII